jgi:hypothetical protein
MPIEAKCCHCLLTAHEAELLAGFRLMSEAAQETVALIIESQARPLRQEVAQPVELSTAQAI